MNTMSGNEAVDIAGNLFFLNVLKLDMDVELKV